MTSIEHFTFHYRDVINRYKSQGHFYPMRKTSPIEFVNILISLGFDTNSEQYTSDYYVIPRDVMIRALDIMEVLCE